MELTFTSCMYFRTPISVTKKETGNFDLKIRKKKYQITYIYIYLFKKRFLSKKANAVSNRANGFSGMRCFAILLFGVLTLS